MTFGPGYRKADEDWSWEKDIERAQTRLMRWGWLRCDGGRLIFVPPEERSPEQKLNFEEDYKQGRTY